MRKKKKHTNVFEEFEIITFPGDSFLPFGCLLQLFLHLIELITNLQRHFTHKTPKGLFTLLRSDADKKVLTRREQIDAVKNCNEFRGQFLVQFAVHRSHPAYLATKE